HPMGNLITPFRGASVMGEQLLQRGTIFVFDVMVRQEDLGRHRDRFPPVAAGEHAAVDAGRRFVIGPSKNDEEVGEHSLEIFPSGKRAADPEKYFVWCFYTSGLLRWTIKEALGIDAVVRLSGHLLASLHLGPWHPTQLGTVAQRAALIHADDLILDDE